MNKGTSYTASQVFWLTFLRVIIGWHFLYEGLVKAVNPNWSSVGYLLDSAGFMKGFFYRLAANPDTLSVVDFMNIWGLITIGLGLILGAFNRITLPAGIVMLAFYYLSHPPFVGLKYELPMEGSYLFINKNFIEIVAMMVLFIFPAHRKIGIDRLIFSNRKFNTENGNQK
jgi:thiosulfate dehydrogenase [quinone] large subunit